jgi:hypothetical protein
VSENLIPVEIPPGISRSGTQYQTSGRWYDCNYVRWVDGSIRPIGGWQHFTTVLIGLRVLTFTGALVAAVSGTLSVAWVFATGSYSVTFSDGSVRACTLTNAATTCTWSGAVTASNTFSVQTGSKARSLHAWVTNNGTPYLAIGTSGALLVNSGDATLKDITPAAFTIGGNDAYQSAGYGGFTYGTGVYGTARSGGSFVPPTIWQLDNFGENLVACAPNPAGTGKIYKWSLDYAAPTASAVIAAAPINLAGIVVTEQRHLMAFGAAGNKRSVKWSAKEDETTWAADSTNEAGGFEIATSGSYVRAVKLRGQILALYSTDAHLIQYIGQPFIFNRERVGADCGLIGPQAVLATGSFVVWMGQKRFWIYDGGGVKPLPCELNDYIFGDIDSTQSYKTACGHNGAFSEIWWHYPSSGSMNNNRYVIWNYRENHWAIGSMARNAWVDSGVFTYPTAIGDDGVLYRHEQGNTADGAAMYTSAFAESGALELPPGDNIVQINKIIPDEKTSGSVTVTLKSRFTPEGTVTTYGPYSVRSDGYMDARASGRQLVMRIVPTADADWRVGRYRLAANALGRR